MEIGERIKEYRKKRKISVDKLAQETGISRSTLFRYENGNIEKIPTSNLLLISQKLNVPFEVLTGEKTNDDTDKYIASGKEMYKSLLEKYPADTYEGKALRYFDDDLINIIIRNAIQVALSAPIYTEKPFDLSQTNFLRFHIYGAFMDFYQEAVKTNQNLINKVLNSLPYGDELSSYRNIDDEIQIPIKIEEIGLDMTLITNTYYASIEENLIDELSKIIDDARMKIEELKTKYPDKQERKARFIIGIDNGEKHPVWEYIDGKEIRDEINIPKEIKDVLIKIIIEESNLGKI